MRAVLSTQSPVPQATAQSHVLLTVSGCCCLLCVTMQLLLGAGSAEDSAAPVSHVRQRKSILLRMPQGGELFLGE